MSELESSGLLKDEPMPASDTPSPSSQQPQPTASSATAPAALTNPAGAIVAAVTASPSGTDALPAAEFQEHAGQAGAQEAGERPVADGTAAQAGSEGGAQAAGTNADGGEGTEGAAAAAADPAEQRVLGGLQGAPHWHEVGHVVPLLPHIPSAAGVVLPAAFRRQAHVDLWSSWFEHPHS